MFVSDIFFYKCVLPHGRMGAWDTILSPRGFGCFWVLTNFSFLLTILFYWIGTYFILKNIKLNKRIAYISIGRGGRMKTLIVNLYYQLRCVFIVIETPRPTTETGSDLGIMSGILAAGVKGKIFVSMGTDPLLHFSKCQDYIWKVVIIFSHFIKIIPCLYSTYKNLWQWKFVFTVLG